MTWWASLALMASPRLPSVKTIPPPAKLVRKAWPPTASVLLTTAVMVYDCVEPAAMVSYVVGDTVVALPIRVPPR